MGGGVVRRPQQIKTKNTCGCLASRGGNPQLYQPETRRRDPHGSARLGCHRAGVCWHKAHAGRESSLGIAPFETDGWSGTQNNVALLTATKLGANLFGDASPNVLHHGERSVEIRLLLEILHPQAFTGPQLSVKLLVWASESPPPPAHPWTGSRDRR